MTTVFARARSDKGVSWSPEGKRIASASDDDTVRFWNAATGDLLTTVEQPNEAVAMSTVAWSPNGKLMAALFVRPRNGNHRMGMV
jgi:WD40 repeat protein